LRTRSHGSAARSLFSGLKLRTLRRIAEDPHRFILRQGWAALDFGEEREIVQLRRLRESIELEIIRVLEAGNALKESPDYELHRLTTMTSAARASFFVAA